MTAPLNDRRYPIDRLFSAMRVDEDFGRRELGISGSSYGTFVQHGMTEAQADRYATRAGLPTHSVWPEMVDDAIADAQRRERARPFTALVTCPECGRELVGGAPEIAEDFLSARSLATCVAGHQTLLTVTLEAVA